MPRLASDDRLSARAQKIVRSLQGTWRGAKGMCRCPAHDDRTPSLSLTLGRQAILFHCFAGCPNEAVLAALASRGVGRHELFDAATDEGLPSRDGNAANANAVRLWKRATFLAGTPAELYLQSRGLVCTSPELRFLARTPLGSAGEVRYLPALIAAVRDDAGVLAIHRIFLSEAGPIAAIDQPKRALGRLHHGAVRLAMPRDGRLGLAEGIESALSATQLFGVPCWATLGNARFGSVAVPESVRELHLFVDNDAGGRVAEARARAAHARDGRTIVTRMPDEQGSDWNDIVMREGDHRPLSTEERELSS